MPADISAWWQIFAWVTFSAVVSGFLFGSLQSRYDDYLEALQRTDEASVLVRELNRSSWYVAIWAPAIVLITAAASDRWDFVFILGLFAVYPMWRFKTSTQNWETYPDRPGPPRQLGPPRR